MIATNKKQITIKSLLEHDEIKTYTLGARLNQCVKLRTIDGKRTFIRDMQRGDVFTSTSYETLKALKASIEIAHF